MGIRFGLGIDSFEKLRDGQYYYVDKTGIIRELAENSFEANLITRPRRFGKTLTMSMLEDFFDISRSSRKHFEGLEIAEDAELCENWMNRWPVISLTLKSAEGNDFALAYERLRILVAELCRKYDFLLRSPKVNEADAADLKALQDKKSGLPEVTNSLYLLTRMMQAHYGKQVILLIDEYDVPLAKAGEAGYYREMLDVVRAMLGKALKTNEFLKFAVLTGCLRIAKESIFTGINNMVIHTIMDSGFREYFGFTQREVQQILADTELWDHGEELKFWYDGYQFGGTDVYCPWDVLNHVNALMENPGARPGSYWENTSHNGVLRQFINRKDLREMEHLSDDIEILLSGGSIRKIVTDDLTYDTLYSSVQNLWSLLLFTGYLTADGADGQAVSLRIPNKEIRILFRTTVKEWFADKVRSEERSQLFEALWTGKEEECSRQLSDMVYDTISYFDYREDFYRAFLVGILSYAGYKVITNKEQGEGRPDIVLLDDRRSRALIIEIKWTDRLRELERKCEEALEQIESRRYGKALEDEYGEILCCGICFFKKRCMVRFGEYHS